MSKYPPILEFEIPGELPLSTKTLHFIYSLASLMAYWVMHQMAFLQEVPEESVRTTIFSSGLSSTIERKKRSSTWHNRFDEIIRALVMGGLAYDA